MQRPFTGAKARIVCTYMYSLPYPHPCIDEKRKNKGKKRNRKGTVLSTHCIQRVCVMCVLCIYVLIFVRIINIESK